MEIIMDNNEMEAAIRLYLQARNIISNGEKLEIDITKLRSADGAVSASIKVVDEEFDVVANSNGATRPASTEKKHEPKAKPDPKSSKAKTSEPDSDGKADASDESEPERDEDLKDIPPSGTPGSDFDHSAVPDDEANNGSTSDQISSIFGT